MAIRYIPRYDEHRYTALSTDDLTQQKFDHGSRIYLTDTHQTLIYNEEINNFVSLISCNPLAYLVNGIGLITTPNDFNDSNKPTI